MGVIAKNAEVAIRGALSRDPLPDSISVRLCMGGSMVMPLTRALVIYADLRRDNEGIVAQRPDLLARIDETFR